jgi:hypothetical protein
MRLNIDSAAQVTKVTENTYVYLQVAFTAEDLYAEVLGRKCQEYSVEVAWWLMLIINW